MYALANMGHPSDSSGPCYDRNLLCSWMNRRSQRAHRFLRDYLGSPQIAYPVDGCLVDFFGARRFGQRPVFVDAERAALLPFRVGDEPVSLSCVGIKVKAQQGILMLDRCIV